MTKWCPNPFQWLDITVAFHHWRTAGFAICSQCWADRSCILGEYTLEEMARKSFKSTLLKEWNSPRVQEIRAEMHNGIPYMCRGCPRLAENCDPPLDLEKITDPWMLDVIANGTTETVPRVFNLGYDPSCNLCCPSCRKEPVRLGPGDTRYDLLERFQDYTLIPLLANAEWVFVSGYGDPFGSNLYWDLMQQITPQHSPNIRWYFLTNGLGFTEENYAAIPTRDRIEVVNVSVDATCEATYKALRGGSWRVICENLEFLAGLRRSGAIKRLELGMVYQAANYLEIPAFVAQAKEYAADKVMLYSLLNHTDEDLEYRAKAVHLHDNPHHEPAMELLRWAKSESGIEAHVEMPNPNRAGVEKAA